MAGTPLPNFFIVGAGKAGTTSLHSYLAQHPQIYMSPVKEPCYFASEIRAPNLSRSMRHHVERQTRALPELLGDGKPVKPTGWISCEWDDYLRLFQNVKHEKAIGEASAAYLWSPTAPANIHSQFPDAKIVMMLRDPAERAFSQYLHQLSVGLTKSGFREHLQECARRDNSELSIFHPFLEIGLYHEQVQRYLDLFPREHIRIYWYEEAWRQPQRMLSDLFEFLDVDTAFQPDTSRRSLERRAPRFRTAHYLLKKLAIWGPMRAMVPPALRPRLRGMAFRGGGSLTMEPDDRRYLVDFYREDIRRLASLLDRDLGHWLR